MLVNRGRRLWRTKQISWLYDLALFVSAVALYVPSLGNGFVGDDLIYFIGNTYIQSFDVLTILGSGATGADYLPLRDLSFAFDHLLWGENPFGYHLSSVVLFGITVVGVKHLFAGINTLLTGIESIRRETPAFLAALLFTLHPNHREVVYAVYNRGAMLTVLFSILSCLLFLRFMAGRKERYLSYTAAFFCFILALMSREYSIILPLVLVLLVFFGDRSKRAEHLVHTAPFFLAAAVFYGIFRQYAVAANFITPSSGSFLAESVSRTIVAFKIGLFYMVRMVTTLGDFVFDDTIPLALVSAVVISGTLYVAFLARRTHPQLLFGILFYLVCLIPVLNFFNTLPIVSPRYSFLPCIGLFFTVMAVPHEGRKKIIYLLGVVLALSWTIMTMSKTAYWKNNITFWELMAGRDKTAFAFVQLGYAYYAEKRYEQALGALNRVEPVPWDPRYHMTVGNSCYELKDYECALRSLEAAMTLDPVNASLPLSLAKVHLAKGDRAGAEKYLDFVISNFPRMREEAESMKGLSTAGLKGAE